MAAGIAAVLLIASVVGLFLWIRHTRVSALSVTHAKSTLVRLTNNSAQDMQPSWSPDGERIAFASNRDGKTEIYVMDTDGSNVLRLTNNEASDGFPRWSPDSRKILFLSDRDGNPEIYVMDADGSNQTRLTKNSADERSPSWSPDGNRIAFASNRDNPNPYNFDIYEMDAEGSHPKEDCGRS